MVDGGVVDEDEDDEDDDEEDDAMRMLDQGERAPSNTLYLLRVSEGEARFLETVPERMRFHWLKRLRRRAGKKLEFLDPDEYNQQCG